MPTFDQQDSNSQPCSVSRTITSSILDSPLLSRSMKMLRLSKNESSEFSDESSPSESPMSSPISSPFVNRRKAPDDKSKMNTSQNCFLLDPSCKNQFAKLAAYYSGEYKSSSDKANDVDFKKLPKKELSPNSSPFKLNVANFDLNAISPSSWYLQTYFQYIEMRRRATGIGAIQKNKQRLELFQQKGNDLAKEELIKLSSQMEEFRVNLSDFAQKYKKDIKKNGDFRRSFQQMCATAGVDPLRSSTTFWTKILGVGDFYYELAIQIVEVFMSTSHRNGGIMQMNELLSRVTSSRNSGKNSNLATTDSITADDIINAIDKLAVLGGTIKVLPSKGTYLIHAVPAELSSDHLSLTQLAHANSGYVSLSQILSSLDLSEDRAKKALDELIMEGLVWVDSHEGRTLYWFPGLK